LFEIHAIFYQLQQQDHFTGVRARRALLSVTPDSNQELPGKCMANPEGVECNPELLLYKQPVKALTDQTKNNYNLEVRPLNMSYRQIFYHIIFGTKYRHPTIDEVNCKELYQYISGIIKKKNCKLYQINGVEDHIHIFSDLHPSVSLSDYVKDIKVASSIWIKKSVLFPKFEAWQDGYGAFTYSAREKDRIINYIRNQKEHHRKETFHNEFKLLLIEHGIEFDEKYLL